MYDSPGLKPNKLFTEISLDIYVDRVIVSLFLVEVGVINLFFDELIPLYSL